MTRQLQTLNTNSRYLHDKLVVLAERITHLMPKPLQVAHAVADTNHRAATCNLAPLCKPASGVFNACCCSNSMLALASWQHGHPMSNFMFAAPYVVPAMYLCSCW